jgi:hypothetical protein
MSNSARSLKPAITEDAREQLLAEIHQLLTEAGLHPKDLYLTQPPGPGKNDEAAYAAWLARERRRKPIARRMALYRLHPSDLREGGA